MPASQNAIYIDTCLSFSIFYQRWQIGTTPAISPNDTEATVESIAMEEKKNGQGV